MTTPTKEALKHCSRVLLLRSFGSPADRIAYAQNDPRWALLIPVINAAWYSVSRYLKEKLIENDISRGDE